MVTKLSGTVVEYSAEGQFQYLAGETSGLSVTVSAGSFMEATGLVEYPETTFSLTDDAVNYIFVNLDVTPATLVASATLPTEGLILLRITTASGVVSAVKDFRNRQFASRLLVPPVGNQLYETLADAEHRWEFKDFTTTSFEDIDFIDDGTSASPINLTNSATQSVGTNVPGATRGSPYEPGISLPNLSHTLSNTSATVVNHMANTSTGAMGIWIKPDVLMSTLTAGRYTIMMQRFINNSGVSIGWAIQPDGAIYAWMDSSSNQVTYVTAAGVVTADEWNFICINQPGDGGGFDCYVNGVEVAMTPTIGGTGSLDDWVDRIYTDFTTPTNFYLITTLIHTGVGAALPCSIQSPFIYEGALSAAAISNIHDAANLAGDAEDVRTWIVDNIDPDYWFSHSYTSSSQYVSCHGKHNVQIQGSGTITGTTGPWTDTDINHFHNAAADFSGAGNPTFFPSGAPDMDAIITDTTGCWGAWVRTPSALTTRRCFISAGSSTVAMCEVGMTASGEFYGRLERSSGNYTELVASGISLSANTWYFVVFQQTGSGFELYIDGTQVTGGNLTTNTSGTTASTDWHNNVTSWTNDSPIRFSGGAGSSSLRNWGDGRLADWFYIESASLTSTQIANIQAATGGTYN